MAFSNGKDGYTWLGKYHPPVPATEVYCDPCGYAGNVPFADSSCVECGWKGQAGDAKACPECQGALNPYSGGQLRPWAWEPAGWNSVTDQTPCTCCGKPSASGVPFWAREKEH